MLQRKSLDRAPPLIPLITRTTEKLHALMAMTNGVSSELIAAVGSGSASVRVVAARALRAARTSDAARDALIATLDDDDPYVRFSAAYTLSIYRHHPTVVEALLARIRWSQDPALVARAVISLTAENLTWPGNFRD